jgi:hypothetical protein
MTTRNTHARATIAALLFIVLSSSCSRLAPFEKQSFRSFDGVESLVLLSRSDAELTERGTTFVCKYTEENGAIRITAEIMGTKQALYFQRVPQGLRSSYGTILLSPASYSVALEEQRKEQQRQAAAAAAEREQERKAEEQRRAGEQRVAAVVQKSKEPTKTLATYDFPRGNPWREPLSLALTDVDLHVSYPKMKRSSKLWFGEFWKIRYNQDYSNDPTITYEITQHDPNEMYQRYQMYFPNIEFAKRFDSQLRSAIAAWRRQFPEARKYKDDE